MWQKLNTIKARIAILSFFIMIGTVGGIVLTEYLLQQQINAVTIYMSGNNDSNINDIDDIDSSTIKRGQVITISQQEFERQQQLKFIKLVSISFILLTIGILLIYLVIRRELRPLEILRKDMDVMDFNRHNNELIIASSNRNEIVSLTSSYNLMIENLKESYTLQKRFNQNAAHELKTPITTMKTSLQVHHMLHPNDDEETNELLEVMDNQISRMEQLVTGLLAITNKKEIVKQDVDMFQLTTDVIQAFTQQIQNKQLTTQIEGTLTLKTDPNIMRVIFRNIIENAIRYNKQGGSITITLAETIKIHDTGIGIANDELERIFAPFYCVDESRSKNLGGFGLGLSMVKTSVEQLGYSIYATSQINQGTTFIINTKGTSN